MNMAEKSLSPLARLEREIRRQLAGAFQTTPIELFIFLGGDYEQFNERDQALMEWHLRTHGYAERQVTQFCGRPAVTKWCRTSIWPEDRQWMEDDDEFTALCGD